MPAPFHLAPRSVFASHDFRESIATTNAVQKAERVTDIALATRVCANY